jgi:hypothetical protein
MAGPAARIADYSWRMGGTARLPVLDSSSHGGTAPSGPVGVSGAPARKPAARGPVGKTKKASSYEREDDSAVYTEAELRDAEAELKVMAKFWGSPYDKTGDFAYVKSSAEGTVYETRSYLRDRNLFFGGSAAYDTYKAAAVAELNATTTTKKGVAIEPLRDALDPNRDTYSRTNPAFSDWRQAQEPYYTWTRKAAELELATLGDVGVDISKLARSGRSPRLLETLKVAETQYGATIKGGGFNFRPKKEKGIRLGTISNHGFGTAMDIDDTHNPIIQLEVWTPLVTWTGVAFTNAERTTWWDKRNKDMYDKIVAINDAFVTKVAASAAKDAKDADKVPAALATFAKTYAAGFINLSWEMVDALHDAGFDWGASFKNTVDLHHFELKPLKSGK